MRSAACMQRDHFLHARTRTLACTHTHTLPPEMRKPLLTALAPLMGADTEGAAPPAAAAGRGVRQPALPAVAGSTGRAGVGKAAALDPSGVWPWVPPSGPPHATDTRAAPPPPTSSAAGFSLDEASGPNVILLIHAHMVRCPVCRGALGTRNPRRIRGSQTLSEAQGATETTSTILRRRTEAYGARCGQTLRLSLTPTSVAWRTRAP